MGDNPETMYLIDSMSLIFQVFHGIPTMTSPTGTPTNAIYGFTRDLMFCGIRNRITSFVVGIGLNPHSGMLLFLIIKPIGMRLLLI